MRLSMSVLFLAASLLWAPAVRASDPVTIAVMYFQNKGNPEIEMLKVGMAQMLITDLSAEQRFEIVERTRINEMLAELDFQETDTVDQATAVNVGRVLGARYLVLGSYFELMGQLRVDARVVDVETFRIVSVGSRRPSTELWDLHEEMVGAIADAIASAEELRGAWDKAHPPKPRMRIRGDSGAARDDDGDAMVDDESADDAVMAADVSEEVTDEVVLQSAPRSSRGGSARRGSPTPKPNRKKSSKKSSGGKVASAEPAPAPAPQPAAEAEPAAESTPAPPKDPMGAAIAFSEGLDYLDRKDMTRARKRFERALELDPELEDARSELASLSI